MESLKLPEIIHNQQKLQQTTHFKWEKKVIAWKYCSMKLKIFFSTKLGSKQQNINPYHYQ